MSNLYHKNLKSKRHSELLILFLIFLLGGLDVFGEENRLPPIPDSWKHCAQDKDCTFVNQDCCGPVAAISQKFKAMQEAKIRQKCEAIACPDVVDPLLFTHLPGCIQGMCKLRKIGDFTKSHVSDCEKLNRPDEQSICFQIVAIANMSFALCERIDIPINEYSKNECQEKIFLAKSDSHALDIQFCSEFGKKDTLRFERCLLDLARQNGDPQICLKITNSQNLQKCLHDCISKTGNVDQCKPLAKIPELGMSHALHCYSAVALKAGNPNVCDQILDLGPRETTYGPWFYCIVDLAKKKQDINICRKVNEQTRPSSYSKSAFDEADCKKRQQRQ